MTITGRGRGVWFYNQGGVEATRKGQNSWCSGRRELNGKPCKDPEAAGGMTEGPSRNLPVMSGSEKKWVGDVGPSLVVLGRFAHKSGPAVIAYFLRMRNWREFRAGVLARWWGACRTHMRSTGGISPQVRLLGKLRWDNAH